MRRWLAYCALALLACGAPETTEAPAQAGVTVNREPNYVLLYFLTVNNGLFSVCGEARNSVNLDF